MPKTLFKIDLSQPMSQQELVGHNRWHPDIPAVFSVNPGEVFRIECKDWTDGQIKDNDDLSDVREVDLTVVHVLSGPIYVNGAEPGDILVVALLDIGALQGDEGGFTGIFDRENGGGFLTDACHGKSHCSHALSGMPDHRKTYLFSRPILASTPEVCRSIRQNHVWLRAIENRTPQIFRSTRRQTLDDQSLKIKISLLAEMMT